MSILTLQNVGHAFGGLRALHDVSFTVADQSITAIIGPNGAGKTTLFNVVSGLLACQTGSVDFAGTSIQGRPPHRIAALGISRTFQNVKLFGHMTVLENVMVGRHLRGRAGFIAGMFSLPGTRQEEKSIREASLELLAFLGIQDLAQQRAGSLAFGKQRMVEFARALATKPKLLLLDEPAAGLNMYETAGIGSYITKIREERLVSIVLVEHDMSLVMDISDRIVVLNYGQKIAEGTPVEIQKNPEVIKSYLGEEYSDK
jgi:branched-chain amino acid transport system ATP-binding protein